MIKGFFPIIGGGAEISLLEKPLSDQEADHLFVINNEYPFFQIFLTSSLGLGIMHL